MAIYIKGDVVPNAKGYSLHKLENIDGKTLHIPIDRKLTGKSFYRNLGRIDFDGQIINDPGWSYSPMIDISLLVDLEPDGCVDYFGGDAGTNTVMSLYRTRDDYSSFITGFNSYEIAGSTKLSHLKSFLEYGGAKYVVFCKPGSSIWVNTKSELNFCLDDYPNTLPAGQTHTLVVRAIGDGVNYSDSEYSNEIIYTA